MSRGKYGNIYTGTKLYNIWGMMKQRCYNKNNPSYKYYGARGILIFEDWNDSVKFCEWALASGYEEGLELDRVDNNGNYEPSNCQWVTRKINTECGKRRNSRNSSGFHGVYLDKRCNTWRVEIYKDCKKICLGSYKLLEDAINAKIEGEIKYFGERKTYMDT